MNSILPETTHTQIDVGEIAEPDYAFDPETPSERCCHILGQPTGTTATAAFPRVALCGFHPNDRPSHTMGDGHEVICPVCERPRCPDCVVRYVRGER